ncbi:MAG: TonB-dependent receptor [Bacteroidales bacterium]|nr:TonB-dependent receptor [Bacteroidales bacterium]
MKHYIIPCLFILIPFLGISQQETAKVFGKVTERDGSPVELVNVALAGSSEGAVTDKQGYYSIEIPAGENLELKFTFVGYQSKMIKLDLEPGEERELNVTLELASTLLPEMVIEDKRTRRSTISSINPESTDKIPTMSSSVESVVKTMPGVSSKNELSNQYSVRGGNYDENLIYVNDIRIYRPFLVRSGRQEGLSFLNSDLVSSIVFSAGGFDAKYGDKMSSVLDIKYKNPKAFGASASMSLLSASFHLEGVNEKKNLSYLLGLRQKSNQYILNTLQTEGQYQPSFTDVQGMLRYDLNDQWDFSFLGNVSRNIYRFIPENRTTDFGTFRRAMRLKIFFDGKEEDRFLNYMGGLTAKYKPFEGLKLKFITSAYHSNENVNYDVEGEYWIGKLGTGMGEDEFGEVVEKQGVGRYLNHARNFLDVDVFSAEHKGSYRTPKHQMEWGVHYQRESVNDEMREWSLLDSAGYTLPYPSYNIGEAEDSLHPLEMQQVLTADNSVSSNRFNGYFQDTWKIASDSAEMSLTGGLRASYWDFNNEFLLSPRATFSYKPMWDNDILFRFSTGYYYQPPFYKAMRTIEGELNHDIRSQKSIHFVLGSDWNFRAFGRPFKFVSEVFYKHLENLIPYEIDNVRIRYFADRQSQGYSTGIDLKVNGEFVKGVESWASLSVMQTRENLKNDFYTVDYNEAGQEITGDTEDQEVAYTEEKPIGYRPRPTDQRVNFSLFFQDYLPKNPTYKMNLRLLYGTGLPVNIPGTKDYKNDLRLPSYRRVDIGFSKQIVGEQTNLPPGNFLNNFESMWVSLEVFNLLDIQNTISYFWVTDVNDRQLAVPNYLTPRRVNLKLNIEL